jgi:hypothetical protein
MREDLPDWLGKPPLRGTDEWKVWLAKWRRYAKAELRDTAADDPDYDYGLLTVEERLEVTGPRADRSRPSKWPRPDVLGPRPKGQRP